MVITGAYVLSRNAHKRPTLVHRISVGDPQVTVCGWDTSYWWSRYYMKEPIKELLCVRCAGQSRVPTANERKKRR